MYDITLTRLYCTVLYCTVIARLSQAQLSWLSWLVGWVVVVGWLVGWCAFKTSRRENGQRNKWSFLWHKRPLKAHTSMVLNSDPWQFFNPITELSWCVENRRTPVSQLMCRVAAQQLVSWCVENRRTTVSQLMCRVSPHTALVWFGLIFEFASLLLLTHGQLLNSVVKKDCVHYTQHGGNYMGVITWG